MIDHVGFPVSDYARAKAFYEKALAPLGYTLIMEVQQNEHDAKAAGFGADGKPDFWIGGEGGLNRAMHIAIAAKDRAAVDAFYRAAHRGGRARQRRARPAAALSRRTTTARSCSIPTGTTSKRCATRRGDRLSLRSSPRKRGSSSAHTTTGARGSGCPRSRA